MPTVSICIPTYNRKEYLKEALCSVFVQTYKDYEVVVVDDGSTDNTQQVIRDAGYDVRYYWVDHVGQYAARNRLIELARGEYITFIDSDDLLLPDAVQELMAIIESYGPNVFAYGSRIGIDENGNEVKRRQRELPSGNIAAELFQFIHVPTCGTMFAKRLYEQEGGFDTSLKRCSAYKLWLQLSLKYEFIAVEGPMYKKRRHTGNVSDQAFESRKIELNVLEDFYYNGGGQQVIPRHRALKRLSQEGYRAGRCALREGLYEEASQFLALSFRRRPNVKALIHWLRATAAKHLELP
jgi:glycosyltransferase involved in cell wall biosynthesis